MNNLRCASCGTPLPGHSRFCLSCGTPVGEVRPAAAGSAGKPANGNGASRNGAPAPAPEGKAAPPLDLAQLLQRELGGEITLGKETGRGPLTVSFAGIETRTQLPVTVHVVPPEVARIEGGVVDRLLRAARTACGLRHPRIVPIVRVAAGDRMAWYVERRVEGEPLSTLMEREYQLPLERVVALVGHVATALGAAHERGYAHGELAPNSVILTPDGGAMVRDFCIARANTSRGIIAPATPATDQGALGAMAWQMLAGSPPAPGETSLPAIRPDLPAALGTVLERALAANPDDRYPGVTRFAAAFRLAAQGRSSPTRGVTRRSNDTLFMPEARNRPNATRSAVAACVATLVLILVGWQAKGAPWSSDTVNSQLVAPRPDAPSVATSYGSTAPVPVPPATVPETREEPSPPGPAEPSDRRPAERSARGTERDERGEAPATGFVTVGTNPPSTIYINGVAAPSNPVRHWSVTPGRVTLRFEVAGANGGTVVTDTTLSVAAGESLNLGFVRLGSTP